MKDARFEQKWFTKADIKVGMVMKAGPYERARVKSITNNGWVRCFWPGAPKELFSVRAHWLSYNPPPPCDPLTDRKAG